METLRLAPFNIKKAAVTAVAGLGLFGALLAPMVAHADTTTATTQATVTIKAGALTLGANQSSTAITASKALDGTGNSYTGASDAGTLSLTDARGTGAGYTVSAAASQLTDTSGHTLSTNNLDLSNVSVSKVDSTSGAVPTSKIASSTAIDSGTSTDVASSKQDTTTGTGMGSYKIALNNLNFAGTVPASAYAGSYSSTVTYTVGSGPEAN